LGLVWQLILKYKFHGHSQTEEMKELLAWVNLMIPDYKIRNFTTDWQSGKAICALAEAIKPGQLNLPRDFKNSAMEDCRLGMECARVNMGILSLVDVEDVVNYPDQNVMMTYISYFRDYWKKFQEEPPPPIIKDDTAEKNLLLEQTPDLSKCIVYGPALVQECEAEQETYFTVEIRNAKDKKIVAPGYEISVKITGPRNQNQYRAKDNGDGTNFVTFTPQTDGNHIIEVKLNNTPIGKSPFYINIKPKYVEPPPVYTKPKPYWFYQDIYETKNWIPFPENENFLIEKQFETYGGGVINLNEFRIDISKREKVNTIKRHYIHLETKPMVRGTWFWEDDNGNMAPYSEEICATLETCYQNNDFNKNVCFTMGKKVRFVSQFPDGSFKQYRQANDASTKGRRVDRGYRGEVLFVEVSIKK